MYLIKGYGKVQGYIENFMLHKSITCPFNFTQCSYFYSISSFTACAATYCAVTRLGSNGVRLREVPL